MIKSSTVKLFIVLLVLAVLLYAVLWIVTAAVGIDTNIDTGNPVVSWLYIASYTLAALSIIGLIITSLVKLLRKLF